jgi:hypothetical protein
VDHGHSEANVPVVGCAGECQAGYASRWNHRGFRLFWHWKSKPMGRPPRPRTTKPGRGKRSLRVGGHSAHWTKDRKLVLLRFVEYSSSPFDLVHRVRCCFASRHDCVRGAAFPQNLRSRSSGQPAAPNRAHRAHLVPVPASPSSPEPTAHLDQKQDCDNGYIWEQKGIVTSRAQPKVEIQEKL